MEFNDDNAYFDSTVPPLYEHFCLSASAHINSGDLESLTFTSKTVLDSISYDSIFVPNILICFTTGDAWYSQGKVKFKYDGSGSLNDAITWDDRGTCVNGTLNIRDTVGETAFNVAAFNDGDVALRAGTSYTDKGYLFFPLEFQTTTSANDVTNNISNYNNCSNAILIASDVYDTLCKNLTPGESIVCPHYICKPVVKTVYTTTSRVMNVHECYVDTAEVKNLEFYTDYLTFAAEGIILYNETYYRASKIWNSDKILIPGQ